MLETAGILTVKAVGIFCAGALLGGGFYLAKKVTNRIDENLAERRELKNEKRKIENAQLKEGLIPEVG
jgi:hypothetical protein